MQSSNTSSDQPQQQQQQQQQGQQGTPAAAPPPPLAAASAPHWMAMQYPTTAMVMQHQMMAPQHYPPPPHYMAAAYHPHPHHPYMQPSMHHHVGGGHQQQQQSVHNIKNNSNANDGSSGENKTIWVGDLLHWMDERYLHNCFATAGEINNIKVIRNKQTNISEGYGFVEFLTHSTAEKVLQSYSGLVMPNTDQTFRLNWATFSSSGDKRTDNASDLSIFVGDLAADVTDALLHETFVSKYPSVKAAKVVIDANSGRSKGYGFVRFGDDNERNQAMTEMNGVYCSTRPMRIGPATPRKSLGYQQANGGSQSDGDSTNTTIFVGGLDPNVTDDELRQPFSQYGEIFSVKIPVGKGCGFVQFANRSNAEEALQKLNGTVVGNQTVRLSWGRNPANKQLRAEFGSQWSGAYYGGRMYDGYGYAIPHPHDPGMYAAAAYGAYPLYGNQKPVS